MASHSAAPPQRPAAFIGTAGWSIRAELAHLFPAEGSQLERYAAVMNCVEINSSFYRPHQTKTYERWAASTPEDFRFAVKLPKQITHEGRLQNADELLPRFMAEAGGLGLKWAALLVQLPPSLQFDAGVAGRFFAQLRAAFGGAIVCEPRHATWFTPEAERLMVQHEVSRAAVDPAKWLGAGEVAGDPQTAYFRWHGSPRIYWSTYEPAWIEAQAQRLKALPAGAARWCIFDNTAAGAALQNALQLESSLRLNAQAPQR